MGLFCLWHWQSLQVDYVQLEKLLSNGKWMEADQETSRIMSKLTSKAVDERSFFGSSAIDPFGGRKYSVAFSGLYSCSELQKIDKLWSKYSQGNFGFMVQSEIARSMTPDLLAIPSSESYQFARQFDKQVGWTDKKYLRTPDWYREIQNPEKARGSLPSKIWLLDIKQNLKPLATDSLILTVERFSKCQNSESVKNFR
ncbi:hypothetical protein WA1_49280 [Scytonema hofmannii PCC 7110]|uniref:GUN4-like domain-containing protein n=2 Tax=Scytonema hofmannii TaxID=34078 RepID=A0A139WQM4_9CYAN|nr:hypothetical protein WA1_49280 [Scytonema hofmannii PCC 7110]